MKKYKAYLIFICIIMLIPILYKSFLKEKETNYKRNGYSIQEQFSIHDKKHRYEFFIKKGKEEYSYTLKQKNHKKTKLIKEIKTYKEGDITCIVPIFKDNISSDILCRNKEVQLSKEMLKENSDYNKIKNKIKKISIEFPSESKKVSTIKNMKVYSDNIPSNYKFIIWDYKGIEILENKTNKYVSFLDYDLYDNIMATTTKKYFVLFENSSVKGIQTLHYYNLETNKYKTMKLNPILDKDGYINGVIGDTLYVTDKKNKKQYSINLKKEEQIEVGNPDILYIKYIDGIKRKVSKKDFFQGEQYFMDNTLSAKTIKKEGNYYYYIEDNTFYKNRIGFNRIALFEMSESKEWNVIDGDVLLLKDSSIYLYTENVGLMNIIEYKELGYNYKGIYYMWKRTLH